MKSVSELPIEKLLSRYEGYLALYMLTGKEDHHKQVQTVKAEIIRRSIER